MPCRAAQVVSCWAATTSPALQRAERLMRVYGRFESAAAGLREGDGVDLVASYADNLRYK